MARLVAFTLGLHMNERGGSCFPSVRTIARESGLAVSTVNVHLNTLIEEGWLHRAVGGGRKSNHYTAQIPPLRQPEGSAAAPRNEPEGSPPGAGEEGVVEDVAPSSLRSSGARAREWTPIYDALLATVYGRKTSDGMTRQEKKQLAVVARELLMAGATPREVERRVKRYRSHETYGGVALTAMSLRAHWSEVAPPTNGKVAVCPECSVGGGMHTADCPRAGRAASG